MSILSEGNNFGIKKPKGSHLDHCKNCGGGWKYTFYVDQTSPEVRSVLNSRGYKDYDSVCPKCIKAIEGLKEDFSMGVEGPLGLNQGIPHGGPGKGVLPKPLYDPKAKAVPPTKKEDDDTEKNKKEMEKSLNKKTVTEAEHLKHYVPSSYIEEVSGEMVIYFDEIGKGGRERDKYYDALDEDPKVKNRLYDLYARGVDEEEAAKKIIAFIDAMSAAKPKLSKNCQLFIRKTDGTKSRLQFVSPAEARNSRTLIDIVDKYTSDWVELWTERYELDKDGYASKTIEGKHIDNPKKVSEKKKCCHGHNRLEEDAKEEYKTALNLLRNLHYQVYNGGIQQCAMNGYLDDLEDYGTNQFIADLRNEIDVSTDAGAECLKAAQMFVNVLDEVQKTRVCSECGGDGQIQEEDEYGDVEYSECSYCNGNGTIEVDRYADADFGDFSDNQWDDKWDEKYYELNGDMIDDATGQTHTHSVVLDALRAAPKNESTIEQPFEDFLQRVDRFLWKAGYESDEIEDYINGHYDELKAAFEDGKTADEAIYNI